MEMGPSLSSTLCGTLNPPDKSSSGKPRDLLHGLEHQWLMKAPCEPIFGFFFFLIKKKPFLSCQV